MRDTHTNGRGDSAAQHTPGPWYVLGDYVSSKAAGEIVCPIKRIRAEDRRLIAAAPELLDALQFIVREIGGGGTATHNVLVAWKACASRAIESATGEAA